VTLNRPEVRNAIDIATVNALVVRSRHRRNRDRRAADHRRGERHPDGREDHCAHLA
jgi:1,4-dihydroxy-2-naphthoyl-CoA synthase